MECEGCRGDGTEPLAASYLLSLGAPEERFAEECWPGPEWDRGSSYEARAVTT